MLHVAMAIAKSRKNNMKTYLILLISLVVSLKSYAAATVDFINVDGDTLYFSTGELKTETSPSCVIAATNNRWAVSLNTQNGQSIYAMLLTAVAGGLKVEITTAGDCNDANGVERPKSVALSQ